MSQLIAHLIGDYCIQNHWMANNKTKAWVPAIVHALLYSIPFLFLVSNAQQWVLIVTTHLLIDRFRLATYWVEFWGVGTEGSLTKYIMHKRGYTRTANSDKESMWISGDEARPRTPDAPPFLKVWLLIIVDNTWHLAINYAVLTWMA